MAYPDGDRFALSTPDDHQAWLWVISILSLMYALVILCTRVIVKWGSFALDDIALGAAYIFGLAQWACIYAALDHGLGKTESLVTAGDMEVIEELVFTSRIFFLAGLGLTKIAVILFVSQLFTRQNRAAWLTCMIYGGTVIAWTFIAPMIVSVECSTRQAIDGIAHCPGKSYRCHIVAALDSALEVGLVAVPAFLFAHIRMDLQKKVIVLSLFAFRLLNALIIIVYDQSYNAFLAHGRPNIGIVETLAWQQALVCYALMSATMPVFKGFISRFQTTDLMRFDHVGPGVRSSEYHSPGSTQKASLAVTSISDSARHDLTPWRDADVELFSPVGDGEMGAGFLDDGHER